MPSALIRLCVLASVFAATAAAQHGADAPRCELFEFRALMPLELVTADLERGAREELRVLAWLEVGDHRSRVLADPREFHRIYESLARYAEGGNWSRKAWRWYPHVVRLDDAGRARFIGNARFRKPEVAIWLFAEGEARDETHVRIELVPVDRASGGFVTGDLVADSFAVVPVESGETGVVYRVRAEREEAYGDWTEARIGQRVAVIVDGVIVSAPIVMSRLPGRGMISGSADAEHVERWIECVRTANRSDPGVVTERGESDERDDAEMRAVLELDRRVSAAKTEYEGDSGLVRSVEQVVEAEPGESVVVHGIAISFGPPGPVNGFLLTTSLWRCLVDPESPATFRVGLPEGQSVATGGVVRVVGRVTREGGRPVMRDAEVTEVDD